MTDKKYVPEPKTLVKKNLTGFSQVYRPAPKPTPQPAAPAPVTPAGGATKKGE